MELKYFTIKEEVQKQRMLLKNIRTDLTIVNQLTEDSQPKTFKEHVQKYSCLYL